MNHISLLNNADKVSLSLIPFPHIIIKDALSKSLANQLTSEFPMESFDTSMNNTRVDISASNVKNANDISSLWKEFINYHSSYKFFYQVLEVFKPCLSDNKYKPYTTFSSGVRGVDAHKEKQILLDAQISINTPVINTSSVRKAHVDNTNKLFSGLYYLRGMEDNSQGGDLELLNWNQSYTDREKIKYYREGVSSKHFSTFKKIKYENNVAILFLNSIDALHLVTPRNPTTHARCFVNLVGELDDDIFTKHGYLKKNLYMLKESVRGLLNNSFKKSVE